MKKTTQEKDKEYFETVESLYNIGGGTLLKGLVERLRAQGSISEGLILEDVLDGLVESPDKETITIEASKILVKRRALGYNTIIGYHTSTKGYKPGDKIPLDTEGKAYFSDIDTLYSARGRKSMNYVYKVSAEGKHRDVRDGWYHSRTPLTILQKWTIEDFIKEHEEARFR